MKNENEIKALLDSLYDITVPYTVSFTGKKSKNVNGLYKPATHEILLHNRNFENDNQLTYTAIHELSHHIIIAEMNLKQVHSTLFFATMHSLLEKAEASGLYKREISPELKIDLDEVKAIDKQISELTLVLGEKLNNLHTKCHEEGVRFEDIIDRDICIKRSTVKKAEKIYCRQTPTSIGQDAQAYVGMMKPEKAETALYLLGEGKSIDQVRQSFREAPDLTKLEAIEKEKEKLERNIEKMTIRLAQVNEELEELS